MLSGTKSKLFQSFGRSPERLLEVIGALTASERLRYSKALFLCPWPSLYCWCKCAAGHASGLDALRGGHIPADPRLPFLPFPAIALYVKLMHLLPQYQSASFTP
eukprot:scaffold297251_cov26-Tisochrysis_lutea.AAC.4